MRDVTAPPWPARPALFLDFDGTLLEIAEEPSRVQPSPRLRALLPELGPATGGAVALISGRMIAEIDRLLEPHRFPAAGIHGLERRDADGRHSTADAATAALAAAREALLPLVERHSGLLLEDKRHALALHFRRRPDLEGEVRAAVAALETRLPPELEVMPGRMVFEIKPRAASKGRAIESFMSERPFRGRTPVFVGDDVTDESGFAVVNALGGVSVKVGDGDSAASFRLADVEAVLDWLERGITS
ncbi:MAG TPA: trehalose-phosphatase [Gammaproteobacteria bacterium]